jgi:hypothetical protein
MSRAVSTVADVTLFLLLVGAAAAAVVHGGGLEPPSTGSPAAEETELLATNTASVEYSLNILGEPPPWVTNATARHRRTAHGTLAELLAEAAMSNATVDGVRVATAGTAFERAVANTTRERLQEPGQRHAVRVRWEPYRGAPVNATTRVGPRPPPSADVEAATIGVPSPISGARVSATAGAIEHGYEGVAAAVAETVVAGLFPPEQAQLALDSDYPSNRLMATRYQRMATLTGAGGLDVDNTSVATLNANLTAALETTVESDMRDRFDTSEAAAESVSAGRITITVRTWSP